MTTKESIVAKKKAVRKRLDKSRAEIVAELASAAPNNRRSRASKWEPSEIQYSWYVLWTAEQWSLRRIAAHAKRSVNAIHETVKKVQKWEFAAMVEHRMVIAWKQTIALQHIYVQAEEAYQRSTENSVTIRTEEIEITTGRSDFAESIPAVKTTLTEVGQAGDPGLLNTKLKALEDIRDIWGVNAPKELKHSGEVGPATALIPITAPNRREAIKMQLKASLALLEKQEQDNPQGESGRNN